MHFDPMNVPHVAICDGTWDDWSSFEIDYSAEGSRLGTAIDINGTMFHVEAIEVTYEGQYEVQQAKDPAWQESFDRYFIAAGAEGVMDTVQIKGREYVVFLSPFCK